MIVDADFEDVRRYAGRAAKEGVSVKHTPTTMWFAIYDGDIGMVGFGGLLIKAGKARVKGDWVLQEHRGKGYGYELHEHRVQLCLRNPRIKVMEAHSLHPRFYEGNGWVILGEYKEGTYIVRRAV